MKYHLLLCIGIIASTQANTPLQDPFPHNQPNKESEEDWKPFSETKPEEINHKEGHTASGILEDEILTAKRKKLDPALRSIVLAMTPQSIKDFAQNIQECSQPGTRKKCPAKALFVGAPGIGKTTLIQAISENADVKLIKINAPFVLNSYKDSGPDNLKAIFKNILNTKTPLILAIDELHCLTDGHKNINNPNQNTAEALWLLIDQCTENPNIILVGIMNDGSKMPEQLKSRFRTDTYLIKVKDETTYKQKILEYYLNQVPHDTCDKCQKKIVYLLPSAEARIIEGIVKSAERIASVGEEDDEWEITIEHLKIAIERYKETESAFDTKDNNGKEKIPLLQQAAWAGAFAGGMGTFFYYTAKGAFYVIKLAEFHDACTRKDPKRATEVIDEVLKSNL